MTSTSSEVPEPTGSHWPAIPSSETEVTTAVSASRIGIPAAISAPNTASSRISVSGIDVHSDFRKSWPSSALATRLVLA